MTQEIALWRAVVQRALADATRDLSGVPNGLEHQKLVDVRNEARAWLTEGNADLYEVCALAAIEPTRFQRYVRGIRKCAWRVSGRTHDNTADSRHEDR